MTHNLTLLRIESLNRPGRAMDTNFYNVSTSSVSSEDREADSRGTSNVQLEKTEPVAETRNPIDGQLALHLISTSEDGLPAMPDNTEECRQPAEPEAEHSDSDLSVASGDVVLGLLYDEAAASDGVSQGQIHHLENAVQKCIAENQILKELKRNSPPEDKEICGEVVQLSREHAADGASDVEDQHPQQPTFVQSHPTTDLRVLEPITDLTPRDVVDKEVDRVAQNSEQPICNIMSTGHNVSDGEEPVTVNRHYDTRVVASDIIASTNKLIVGPQEFEEPLVTGTDFAFHSRDRGLQASLGTSYMVSSDGIPQYAPMNDEEVAEPLVTGISSAFLARHSQDGGLLESLQASAGASYMVSSVGIPQPAPIHGQDSTRGPSENDCACCEVNSQNCRVHGTITPTKDTCCICLQDAFSGCWILPCSHRVHTECFIGMISQGGRDDGFICPSCGYVFLRRG